MFQARYLKVYTNEMLPEGNFRVFYYNGYTYALYEDGRLWSFKRGRLLNQQQDKDGYTIIYLKETSVKLHRLICYVYHGTPKNGQVVRHLDGNPANNHKDNLCWGSNEENWEDRKSHERINAGKRCTTELVYAIRLSYMLLKDKTEYRNKLHAEYGVSKQTIGHIVTLKTWNYPKAIPKGYEYDNNSI